MIIHSSSSSSSLSLSLSLSLLIAEPKKRDRDDTVAAVVLGSWFASPRAERERERERLRDDSEHINLMLTDRSLLSLAASING